MSADYQNRRDWLARRATPKRLPVRMFWNSGTRGTYAPGNPTYGAQCNRELAMKRERARKAKGPTL